MWALKRAVNVESETGHVVIRIPCESTIYQLAPPREIDLTYQHKTFSRNDCAMTGTVKIERLIRWSRNMDPGYGMVNERV